MYLSERLGGVCYMRGPCCYQAMSKLIIVKSMVGTIEHNGDDEPHERDHL